VTTLFLAGPFVDDAGLALSQNSYEEIFKQKKTQVMNFSLWIQVLEKYFPALRE